MKTLVVTVMALMMSAMTFGQSFEYIPDNPFNVEVVGLDNPSNVALKYMFHDEDQDGDLDLILMGLSEPDTLYTDVLAGLRYFIAYQENIGTKTAPSFAPREDRFEAFHFPVGRGFMVPEGGDLNNDGRIDFVVSAETDNFDVQYLQFQIQNPGGSFTVTNCLDWDLDPFSAYSFFVPELTDLDNDGDLDILMGGYYHDYDENIEAIETPTYLYAKNIGTPEDPEFLGWYENPYGLIAEGQSFMTSGDLDLDGEMDLLNLALEDDVPILRFFDNMGTTKPAFGTGIDHPFGLPAAIEGEEDFLFPNLVDIDTDGDLDLFLPVATDEDFELRYYQNNDCEQINTDLSVNESVIVAPEYVGYTYTWIDCMTSEVLFTGNAHEFDAPYSGSFAVIIRDDFGCKSESECVEVTISSTDELLLDKSIALHPTPTDGMLYISNVSTQTITAVDLINAKGERVYVSYSRGQEYIDLTGMEAGLYLVRLKIGDVNLVRKVVLVE